ncbi:MAG: hypothetical protein AB1540_10305 [Bdellovibrionota bacterium]
MKNSQRILRILISNVVVVSVLSFTSCGGKPQKLGSATVQFSENIRVKTRNQANGLWLSTTNYQNGGKLFRLDLKSDSKSKEILVTGNDVRLLTDGNDGIFMLTRQTKDSLSRLKGQDGQIEKRIELPEGSNPQYATRDSLGRVWVSSFESNTVDVFSADLSQRVGGIDLGTLKDPSDSSAELSQILWLSGGRMAVVAQRLARGRVWAPEPQSGLAIIDIRSLALEFTMPIDVPNPIAAKSEKDQVLVIGSGDLSQTKDLKAREARYSLVSAQANELRDLPGIVIDVSFGSFEDSTTALTWYPAENKSCIAVEDRQILCESTPAQCQGYTFSKVHRIGDVVFASYVACGNAELWAIPVDGSAIEKHAFEMRIESMTHGP